MEEKHPNKKGVENINSKWTKGKQYQQLTHI
jgi:hypothetical protein